MRGTVSTEAGSPVVTVRLANMPGKSLRSGLANTARAVTLREFGADARVDRLDLALETAAGDGVDGHADDLTDGERAQSLLGHGKVGVDRVKLLQRHQARAHRDILPEIDIAQAEPAGEGRLDRLLGDDGARSLDGRRRRIAGRERRVDGRLGGIALRDERLLARERRIGVLQLRKAIGEVGLLDRIVDIDEQRARFDVFARLEMLRGHHPGR